MYPAAIRVTPPNCACAEQWLQFATSTIKQAANDPRFAMREFDIFHSPSGRAVMTSQAQGRGNRAGRYYPEIYNLWQENQKT
jgi:hypothetical protein